MSYLERITTSIHYATAATAAALAVLIITAEKYAPLKDWLKATFSHHWLGKGALAILFFMAVTIFVALLGPSKEKLARLIIIETIIVALSAVVICVFFFLHAQHLI